MKKQLPDGRYRVSVLCPDGVRRSCTVGNKGAAKLMEAFLKKGWGGGASQRSVQRVRTQDNARWTLADFVARMMGHMSIGKKGRH
jgi:hypothetical protein